MKRIVEPEWLDELPAEDPAALGSLRDIGRLNRIMGNVAALRGLLAQAHEPPKRIIELGAGDGRFNLEIARHFSSLWPNVEVILVDCKNTVSQKTIDEFGALGWKLNIAESDVFEWLELTNIGADIIFANLFLHQFSDDALERLLELVSKKARLFAACEPRRAAMPLALSRMVGFIGCNAVTRHDAPVSVRAGFDGDELSALWPADDCRLSEQNVGLCSHTFLAQ